MMRRTLLVAAVAASVAARRCWDDDWCPENEFCNLQRRPGLRCEDGLLIQPWGRCAGRENCCTDGFECRGRWIKSCKPIVGTCEPVEAKVCDGKTQCGGITGASCNSRSHVCIDNPDDDCDPTTGDRDCGGCCVFDLCQQKECHKGDECKLNARGEAECVRAPECEEGSTWKQDCNTCTCTDGKASCTEKACPPACTEYTAAKQCTQGRDWCYNAATCECEFSRAPAQCLVNPCDTAKCDLGFECRASYCGGCNHLCVKAKPAGCAALQCAGNTKCVEDKQTGEGKCVSVDGAPRESRVPLVCGGKTQCGGITGASCNSRSHVCIDNPDDDCDPATGDRDCGGCCVFDLCQQKECHKGDECKLNARGEAECVRAPECEEGSTWKQDCNTCTCTDGKASCTEKACPPACTEYTAAKQCTQGRDWCYNAATCECEFSRAPAQCLVNPCDTAKCDLGFECRASYCGGCNHLCVKAKPAGCAALQCAGNTKCVEDKQTGEGKCVPVDPLPLVCDGKTQCGGITGASCNSRSHVCIDNPDDDCDPATGDRDCGGCCVFDLCQQKECHKGDECKLNARGEAECVRAPECEEGSTWKQDCNTCTCTDGKASCTEKACPPACTEYTAAKQCTQGRDWCYNAATCECEFSRAPAQCLVNPCDTAKCDLGFECQASYCGGCNHLCVKKPVVCCQAVPTCPAGFEQTEEAACTKQMWESEICVRVTMCCKTIVCRTYIK